MRLAADGRVDVNTVSGEVALRIPETADAEVSLNSAAGRIDTSFPELGREERTVARNVTGKLGAGTGRLTVNTVSGAVDARRPRRRSRRRRTPDGEVRTT